MKFILLFILIISLLFNNNNVIGLNINNGNINPTGSITTELDSSSSSSSSIKCILCEFFVERIETYLEGNATQNQIEYYLDKDCKRFGGEYASPCTVYVNEYVPILVNYMASHEKSDTVCQQVNFC